MRDKGKSMVYQSFAGHKKVFQMFTDTMKTTVWRGCDRIRLIILVFWCGMEKIHEENMKVYRPFQTFYSQDKVLDDDLD